MLTQDWALSLWSEKLVILVSQLGYFGIQDLLNLALDLRIVLPQLGHN